MKQTIFLLLLVTAINGNAQMLQKIWETGPVVATPESVLPDSKTGTLYISLIDGAPWEKDGRGGIGRMKEDGTGYDSTWITGLSAPKGMAIRNGKLYVADIEEVVVIDMEKGGIEKKIPVEGSQNLNDVTATESGIIYVSDSKAGKVYRLENDQPLLYLEGLQGVNGLRAVGEELWIAAGKSFVKAGADKNLTKLADLPQGGDGVEPVGNGDFLVTSWPGYIFYVKANGTVTTMLETHADKKNTADIGYDPVKRIIYVPTFFARTITAYRLTE